MIISGGNFKESWILSVGEELTASISRLMSRFCISNVEHSDSATDGVYNSIDLSITSRKCEEEKSFPLFPEVFYLHEVKYVGLKYYFVSR